MADPTSIITAIAAIKNSIDIAKAVKDADYDLDKAILKEKIVNLVDSLHEAQIKTTEYHDLIQEKDAEIERLKIKLRKKVIPKRHELPENCTNILRLLSNNPSALFEIKTSLPTKTSEQEILYFLDILEDYELIEKFISSENYSPKIFHYRLSAKGRKFVFETKSS